jgi:hypothetical protein
MNRRTTSYLRIESLRPYNDPVPVTLAEDISFPRKQKKNESLAMNMIRNKCASGISLITLIRYSLVRSIASARNLKFMLTLLRSLAHIARGRAQRTQGRGATLIAPGETGVRM